MVIDHIGMIEPEQRHQSRLVVVRRHNILDSLMTKFVSGAVDHARLDTTAGHPDTEALAVVISARGGRIAHHLSHRQSANFSAPVDDRRIQHAALLEILDERRGRLIGTATDVRQRSTNAAMVVPRLTGKKQLHETDAPLHQSSRDQTSSAVFASRVVVETVHGLSGFGFLTDVKRVRRSRLHPRGEFVAGNACFQIRITAGLFQMSRVQFLQERKILLL